jgi:hypothetical protein
MRAPQLPSWRAARPLLAQRQLSGRAMARESQGLEGYKHCPSLPVRDSQHAASRFLASSLSR